MDLEQTATDLAVAAQFTDQRRLRAMILEALQKAAAEALAAQERPVSATTLFVKYIDFLSLPANPAHP